MARRITRPWWCLGLLVGAGVIHVVMLVSLHTRTLNPLHNDTYNRPGPGADFFALYHAGRQVMAGDSPYLMHEEPRVTPEFAPFRYPPGVAQTLGLGVAQVKPWVAYSLWLVVLELLLLLDILVARRMFTDSRLRDVVTAAWLGFTPLYPELWMGQFTFATASMLFLAVGAWRRGASRAAAGLWAVAAAIKLYGLALVPWLVRRRRWATLAVGAAVVASSLAWFIGRPEDFEQFVRLNVTEVDLASFHAGNFGLQALLYELTGGVRPEVWRSIALACSLSLIAAATLAMTVREPADDRVSVALALLLLPLVSKHAWEHHYVVMLPALTLLVAAWRDEFRRLVLLGAVYAVVWMPSPLILMQTGGPTWHPEHSWSWLARVLYHAPKPLAALTLFIVCVHVQLRRPGSAATTARRSR